MFHAYELRTTDVDGAAAFYGAVLGWTARDGGFFAGDRRVAGLATLPERARAAGAPPHWLGFLRVDDVAAAAARWTAIGGEQRGPVHRGPTGDLAVMRDAQGAPFALHAGAAAPSTAVVWHELHTTDDAAAWAAYRALHGWIATGDAPYRTFTWPGAAGDAGAMIASARSPEIHTHWLFHFAVADLASAIAHVRALGGTVIGPIAAPDGSLVAACEDAQRAAFALRQPPTTA